AVGAYRVATAPVHYAFKGHRGDSSTTATTTETPSSDVTAPGETVPAPTMAVTQQSQPVAPKVQNRSATITPRVNHKETSQAKTKPAPSTHADSAQLEFPTSKSVPGKPRYVRSPFDAN